MGRNLKNFDIYMDKLRLYLRACELTLEYRDVPGDGMYIPSRRVIKLDKDLPESTEIATLLHEAGHSMDDALNDPDKMEKLDKAYVAFYSNTATKKQKQLVYDCEQRAWDCGRAIGKSLRIRLGKWYDDEMKDAINDYKDDSPAT